MILVKTKCMCELNVPTFCYYDVIQYSSSILKYVNLFELIFDIFKKIYIKIYLAVLPGTKP